MPHLIIEKTNKEFQNDVGDIVYHNTNSQPIVTIPEVNQINLFVGANNSGKSKFLRGLLKSNKYPTTETDVVTICTDVENKISIVSKELLEYKSSLRFRWSTISSEILKGKGSEFKFFEADDIIESLASAKGILEEFRTNLDSSDKSKIHILSILTFFKFLQKLDDNPFRTTYGIEGCQIAFYGTTPTIFANLKKEWKFFVDRLEVLYHFEVLYSKVSKKIFIPTLRTTHSLYSGDKNHSTKELRDIFEASVFINYKFDVSEHIEAQKITIHTGLNLYNKIKETKNGYDDESDSHDNFQNFMREHFFSNYTSVKINSLIKNHNEEQNITVRFSGEKGKPIHQLGDGINALINILYPVFTAEKDSWIFIEEPEVHLHPGMQRIFINELVSNELLKEKNLTFFITTHSNHLLDIGSNVDFVSIYSFSKLKENHHQIRLAKSRDMGILNELGVQNSSVYLSNCTIWVEGMTDRLYLLKYLSCYIQYIGKTNSKIKTYNEDLHFAFFLYGGSNIVHYIFKEEKEELQPEQKQEIGKIRANFLSNRVLLIADGDRDKEKRHELFTGQVNEFFLYEKLKVREVENLLSSEFLKQNLHLVVKSISSENISKLKFHAAKLKSEYLGSYISDCAKEVGISNFPKTFQGESGTISSVTYKKLLAEVAYENMTWDLMTKEAQELAETIYNFIASNNQ